MRAPVVALVTRLAAAFARSQHDPGTADLALQGAADGPGATCLGAFDEAGCGPLATWLALGSGGNNQVLCVPSGGYDEHAIVGSLYGMARAAV